MRRDNGVRQKLMGGGMSTARKDMRSGYYPSDMGHGWWSYVQKRWFC